MNPDYHRNVYGAATVEDPIAREAAEGIAKLEQMLQRHAEFEEWEQSH